MIGIRHIPKRSAGLCGIRECIAERIVIHARSLARYGPIERAKPHSGRSRAVYLHVHAALGAAKPAEGEEFPVRVFRRNIHVVGSARVADSQVKLCAPTAECLECMIDRGGNALRAGRAGQRASGTAASYQTAKEIPVVFKAFGSGSETHTVRIHATERLPPGVAGRNDLRTVIRRNRRKRRGSQPVRRYGLSP